MARCWPRDEPFFSYGHNGSGTRLQFFAECWGLGMHTGEGDRGGTIGQSEIAEREILRPSEMVAIADSRGDGEGDSEISAARLRIGNYPGTRHFGEKYRETAKLPTVIPRHFWGSATSILERSCRHSEEMSPVGVAGVLRTLVWVGR